MAQSVAAIVRQVREQARAELVSATLANESRVVQSWAPVLRTLRSRLATARPEEVDAIIAEATREMARRTVELTSRGVSAAVRAAASAVANQHERLTGRGGPMHSPEAAPRAQARISPDRARTLAEAAVNGSFTRDRVPLASRLYRNADDLASSASTVVRESIAARESMYQATQTFLEHNRESVVVPIPRYAQELMDAARRAVDTGDRQHLEDTIARHLAQMERLGEGMSRSDGPSSLRASVRQFVHDLRGATPQNIEQIIARHVEDRAQYQAQRIVRTETVEAHRRAFRASAAESPYTVGLRWKLSSAHPRPDVCDLLANQDLYGLGPGGYPLDAVPETPHPHCICTLESILDEHYFRRKLAERRGEEPPPRSWESGRTETADAWLSRQPHAYQDQLLGPTRAAILRDPDDRRPVIDIRGVPIPVRHVLAIAS